MHIKQFDDWNTQKKQIHQDGEYHFYGPREIWWCYLGANVGFEQDGTGREYQRPVLILKGFSRETCWVIPLTTSEKINPYHVPLGVIDSKVSFAIISQLRLIDTKRLINRIGFVDTTVFTAIQKTIKDLL